MKRLLCLLLALVLLSGCAPQNSLSGRETGVQFYYVVKEEDYFSSLGVMGCEARTLSEKQNSLEGLMALYLGGPVSSELTSDFPAGMRLVKTEQTEEDSREITLVFDDSLAELTGIRLQIVCACIARTVSEYAANAYQTVNFRAEHLPLDNDQESISIRLSDLVLEDHSAGQSNLEVQLYFSDPDSRYLIGEPRSIPAGDSASLSKLIVQKLIEGPESESLRATIPEGTTSLSVDVVDRVCVVNFSEEFRTNKPQTALEERMTVFSVVNSLTQLEGVDAVDILIQGEKVPSYTYLNLSYELQPEERMIGTVETDPDGFDVTLYVGLEGSELLAAFPMRIQGTAEGSRAGSVLEALCSFEANNGYYSPAEGLVKHYDIQEAGGIVQVTLTADAAEEAQLRMLSRSVIATLSELTGVHKVFLFLNDEEKPQSSDSFRSEWILP